MTGDNVEILPCWTFLDSPDMYDVYNARDHIDHCCWKGKYGNLGHSPGYQISSCTIWCKISVFLTILVSMIHCRFKFFCHKAKHSSSNVFFKCLVIPENKLFTKIKNHHALVSTAIFKRTTNNPVKLFYISIWY